MKRDILEVKGLRTYFFLRSDKIIKAVDGVSFCLKVGESLGIVGESGSGKTITALTIIRLLPPRATIVEGEILFEGENLLNKTEKEMRKIRGKKISMILQDPMVSLNPLFTIGEQIAEPLRLHLRMRGTNLRKEILNLLNAVKIATPEVRTREYPHQMSGGMLQRIVGAIAISCNPQVIIADEPTTSLDATVQAQYLELLKELQEKNNISVIFITHDLGIVSKTCNRVAVMYGGKIVERGSVEDIISGEARHPYTIDLLSSVPKLDERKNRLPQIEGQPPDMGNLPSGCSYHPRCKKAIHICREKSPDEIEVGSDLFLRCWLLT